MVAPSKAVTAFSGLCAPRSLSVRSEPRKGRSLSRARSLTQTASPNSLDITEVACNPPAAFWRRRRQSTSQRYRSRWAQVRRGHRLTFGLPFRPNRCAAKKKKRKSNECYRQRPTHTKRVELERETHCRKMTVELCLPMPNTSVTSSRLTVCASFALMTASFRRVWSQIRTMSEAVATMAHLSAGAGAALAMTL